MKDLFSGFGALIGIQFIGIFGCELIFGWMKSFATAITPDADLKSDDIMGTS